MFSATLQLKCLWHLQLSKSYIIVVQFPAGIANEKKSCKQIFFWENKNLYLMKNDIYKSNMLLKTLNWKPNLKAWFFFK